MQRRCEEYGGHLESYWPCALPLYRQHDSDTGFEKKTWEVLRGKLVIRFRKRAKKKERFEDSQKEGVASFQEVGLSHSSEEVG